jgi:hypothetical protein
MTSFAFILGVVPLLVTTGAGAEMRRTLGTAVFSGMLGVTLFGIFLTPVFYYVIAGFAETPLFSSERARAVGNVLHGLGEFLQRRRGPRKALARAANGVLAPGSPVREAGGASTTADEVPANGQAIKPGGERAAANGEAVGANASRKEERTV